MGDLTPEALVADIKDLVTLPEVALRIARMVDDPDSSAGDIGREIGNVGGLHAPLFVLVDAAALEAPLAFFCFFPPSSDVAGTSWIALAGTAAEST